MSRRLVPAIAVLVVVALMVGVILLWTAGPTPRTRLTPEMQKDFGAAAHVPQDVSAYASRMRLAEAWKDLWHSNAVQSLAALPLAQDAWRQVQQNPQFAAFMQALETEPVLVQGLPVLEDAVSSEVFACTGRDFPAFLRAAGGVLNTAQLAGFKNALSARDAMDPHVRRIGPAAGRRDTTAEELIDAVLANEQALQVPSLLLGFKLARPEAARKFLDTWIPQIGPTPFGAFRPQTINGIACQVFELHGETLFGMAFRSLPRDLARAGVPPEKANRFVAWLMGLRLKLAVGVAGEYLLVSIGKETDLLASWGKGTPLAKAAALDPLRAAYKPGLESLSYTSPELADVFTPSAEDVRRFARNIAAAIPERPATKGLKERIEKDAELLIKDLEFPVPSAGVACTFRNKGTEALAFGGKPSGGLDYSRPLTILAHRSRQPILYSASRAARDPEAYDKAVKWMKVVYGYYEDFAVPAMPPENRKDYEAVMAVLKPLLASLDDANRACLMPALDGAQYLLVVDGRGTLAVFPDGTKPPKPIPLPRLGIAVELNDPHKFTQGIERYAEALRRALDDARKAYPKHIPPMIALPPPQTEDTPAGKLYYYKLPWDLGRDVFPCALLKGRLLILASSVDLASDMAAELPMPTSPVTSPDKAAGSVTGVDCQQAWDALARATDAVVALIETDREAPRGEKQQAMLVKMHLDALWRSLGAVRSYSSTTTLRNGRVVTHSWLHVEDIPK